MKNKITKFFAVTLFSATVLLLLGSVPNVQKTAEHIDNKEFTRINNTSSNALPDDFDTIVRKNPSILFEISVE